LRWIPLRMITWSVDDSVWASPVLGVLRRSVCMYRRMYYGTVHTYIHLKWGRGRAPVSRKSARSDASDSEMSAEWCRRGSHRKAPALGYVPSRRMTSQKTKSRHRDADKRGQEAEEHWPRLAMMYVCTLHTYILYSELQWKLDLYYLRSFRACFTTAGQK
jgi:hypothetical protein